jgi:uncharacterized protein (TIGR02145 family)
MKTKIWLCPLAVMVILTMLTSSCKKDKKEVPALETSPVTYVTKTSVTIEGNITSDGGEAVTERGICWSTSPNPAASGSKIANGSGTGSFTCTISGLNENTKYYVRAYSISSAGTGYGAEISFRTWNVEEVTDIDNNIYHTVTIGTQVWLVENLKVVHYSNGDEILHVSANGSWENTTTGAYCDYNNEQSNAYTFGRLYNWFAASDGRNIAPVGWHVPSDTEWDSLAVFLGGEGVAGGKLKETGTTHWLAPNSGATNESGFSGLPGGHRIYDGSFDYINWGGGWWSATTGNDNDAWIRYLDCGNYDIWRYLEDKRYGRSVRCVKD